MKNSAKFMLYTGVTPQAGAPWAPQDGCASCLTFKTCVPGYSNQPDLMQFERIMSGRRRVARHASLYRQRDRLDVLYLVRFGQFKLIGGDLDDQVVLGFYMPGDLLGFDGIATGRYAFRMMALENSEVCEIPFTSISQAMGGESGLQRQFLQLMSASLVREFSHSRLLSMSSLDQRFASFLLTLGGKYAQLGYSGKSFRLAMSRGDIASYLGATGASVSRLIGRFNAHGAVSIRARMVELRDTDYLSALAAGNELHPGGACRALTSPA